MSEASIMVKEHIPTVVAAALWGRRWSGSTIICRYDNEAVVAAITSRTSHEKQWFFF